MNISLELTRFFICLISSDFSELVTNMTGFPKIPLVLGDTDDDASIHLNSKVGPSKPLRPMKSSDKQILQILNDNEPVNPDEYKEFNRNFEIFQHTGRLPNLGSSEPHNDGDRKEQEHLNYLGTGAEPQVPRNDFDNEDDHDDQDYIGSDFSSDELDDDYSDHDDDYNDDDDDATEVESVQSSSIATKSHSSEHSVNDSPPENVTNSKSESNIMDFIYRYKTLFATFFIVIVVEIIVITSYKLSVRYSSTSPNSNSKMIENYYEINSKFNKIDDELSKISKINTNLINNQELLALNYNELNNNINITINKKFHELSQQFNELGNTNKLLARLEELLSDFSALQTDFNNFKSITNFTEFDQKLTGLSDKLAHLNTLNNDFESLKSEFLQSLVDSLPNYLPIYIKNNKIHYIPEFNRFLYNFVDSYLKEQQSSSSSNETWHEFLLTNKESLNQHITQILKDSNMTGMNKQSFYKLLNQKLTQNNQVIYDKFNSLVDNLNIATANSTDDHGNRKLLLSNSNELLLNNLLEIFAKGSINTNYADYKLGARILGFLTTVPGSGASFASKSLGHKLFLGWYDYLANSSPSLKQLKSNANNLLIDGGESWQCEDSQTCSVGIRLSNSIILTDLILKSINLNDKPHAVSIYIKPSSKLQYNNLLQYLQDFKIPAKFKYGGGSSINSKYLSKFIKVKELLLSNDRLDHIKLPISLINLKIPVKDIYLEFHNLGRGDKMEVFNLKAYGVSEYNSYKFSNEFNLLINSLQHSIANERTEDKHTIDNEDSITIDDEYDIAVLGEESL